jgi:hypothetical protein
VGVGCKEDDGEVYGVLLCNEIDTSTSCYVRDDLVKPQLSFTYTDPFLKRACVLIEVRVEATSRRALRGPFHHDRTISRSYSSIGAPCSLRHFVHLLCCA